MCPTDKIDVLLFEEIWNHVCSEDKAYSSLVLVPAFDAFLWVWPEKIAQDALVRDLDRSYYL